ncbi:MAG: GNAT family N-acetyltransferase [Candidatus Bathyarchaeia archaeon]
MECYHIGYINEKPVGTSTLFIGGGVAGVWGVSVVPNARKKGIGTAMTVVPLLDAKSKGLETAVLFASKMGKSVYQNIGFQEIFKVKHYIRKDLIENGQSSANNRG